MQPLYSITFGKSLVAKFPYQQTVQKAFEAECNRLNPLHQSAKATLLLLSPIFVESSKCNEFDAANTTLTLRDHCRFPHELEHMRLKLHQSIALAVMPTLTTSLRHYPFRFDNKNLCALPEVPQLRPLKPGDFSPKILNRIAASAKRFLAYAGRSYSTADPRYWLSPEEAMCRIAEAKAEWASLLKNNPKLAGIAFKSKRPVKRLAQIQNSGDRGYTSNAEAQLLSKTGAFELADYTLLNRKLIRLTHQLEKQVEKKDNKLKHQTRLLFEHCKREAKRLSESENIGGTTLQDVKAIHNALTKLPDYLCDKLRGHLY